LIGFGAVWSRPSQSFAPGSKGERVWRAGAST
jgi:hypothetical protein